MGRLVVDVSGRMTSSGLQRAIYQYVPKMSINGAPPLVLSKGLTVVNLPAGHYHLVVGVSSSHTHSFHYGRAHATVTVWPQQTTTIYYHAPWTVLSGGAIGPSPQQPPDKYIALAIFVLVAVVIAGGVAMMLTG